MVLSLSNVDLTPTLSVLTGAEQQDPKTVTLDMATAQQVRDELNKLITIRMQALQPGVNYGAGSSGGGTGTGGTGTSGTGTGAGTGTPPPTGTTGTTGTQPQTKHR